MPQIILNEDGIQTSSTPFYKWDDIQNEEAISERSGKSTNYYLIYAYRGGEEKLEINDLDINLNALNNLLILYLNDFQYPTNLLQFLLLLVFSLIHYCVGFGHNGDVYSSTKLPNGYFISNTSEYGNDLFWKISCKLQFSNCEGSVD